MSKVTMPEPDIFDGTRLDGSIASHGYSATALEAYAAAKVRGALKEALARVGDYGHFPPITAFENGYDRGREKACAIIRALIPKENT